MSLSLADVIIIAAYLVFSAVVGLALRKRASGSMEDFFLGGRNLPWYLAGISMVATTFAADTPLLVSGLVAKNGISGNWIWWNMLIGGMLTVFFFAHLWRRSGVLTELEFIEFRYSGKSAAFLRGFKAVYLGVFLNVLVIGWVNYAMLKILGVFFGMSGTEAYWTVGGLMLLVAVYSSLSGLLGVAVTDAVQFLLAMGGCIVLAFLLLDLPEVGGIAGLREKLDMNDFKFVPRIGADGNDLTTGTLAISAGAFLTHSLVQWWASWYPGAEPGGGGYVAQRMMSTRTEQDARKATMLFQVLHYAVRPWPWIIVGLCAMVLYPDLPQDRLEEGFVLAMRDYLPNGLKGLLVAAFLAAYMSTISTQLNWGASFLSNDLYARFIERSPDRTKEVLVGRIATVLIMLVAFITTAFIESIESTFLFLIECGAGIGLVLILRWYWWRVSAISELVATIAPFVGYSLAHFALELQFPESFLFTTGFTTVAWLGATFASRPTDPEVLERFYRKVRPAGWWGQLASTSPQGAIDSVWALTASWLLATTMTYSILFSVGKCLLQEYTLGAIWAFVALISMLGLRATMSRGYSLSNDDSRRNEGDGRN
jgi:Na+/proline symporter